ncbi:MAG TPA: choice-of-anchor tandem repeat GloVer-containing protein [Rhizomicrobium sp.]
MSLTFTPLHVALCGLALLILASPNHARAQVGKESVVYAFQGGNDGEYPRARLTRDKLGNFYGTTYQGGAKYSLGTVFKVTPQGQETILYTFGGQVHAGDSPLAGLIRDRAGNLYGTASSGGSGCGVDGGCGTVFKLAPDGTETPLYVFGGGSDGASPTAGLLRDKSGNFYGTAELGGNQNCQGGCGVVFKLAPDGTETVLYSFKGGNDGMYPFAALIDDAAGNFYGTTPSGGGGSACTYGCGTVFKLAPDGTETVIHAFAGGTDGFQPLGRLIADGSGNLYGTTSLGGTGGSGIIFKISSDGTETILHAFTGGSDGLGPIGGLVAFEKRGIFYGTTSGGGGAAACAPYGCGTVFKLTQDGTETVLYAFAGGNDGASPQDGLTSDGGKFLYGTTESGGGTGCNSGCGTVFRLRK